MISGFSSAVAAPRPRHCRHRDCEEIYHRKSSLSSAVSFPPSLPFSCLWVSRGGTNSLAELLPLKCWRTLFPPLASASLFPVLSPACRQVLLLRAQRNLCSSRSIAPALGLAFPLPTRIPPLQGKCQGSARCFLPGLGLPMSPLKEGFWLSQNAVALASLPVPCLFPVYSLPVPSLFLPVPCLFPA